MGGGRPRASMAVGGGRSHVGGGGRRRVGGRRQAASAAAGGGGVKMVSPVVKQPALIVPRTISINL